MPCRSDGEEFMQERRALCRIHAMDEHGAATGQRKAETVYRLVGLCAVDIDGLAFSGGVCERQRGRLLCEERGTIGSGEPESGGLLRVGRNAEQRKGGEDNRNNEFRAHRRSPDKAAGVILEIRLFQCRVGLPSGRAFTSFRNPMFRLGTWDSAVARTTRRRCRRSRRQGMW